MRSCPALYSHSGHSEKGKRRSNGLSILPSGTEVCIHRPVKLEVLSFLIEQKRLGEKVAAYGAAAKGNTLLNFLGVKNDFISYVVDANPHKQNRFLPASHIPVVDEGHLAKDRPDYVLILPWNLQAEITSQLAYIRQWGGKFVIPIPHLQLV